MNGTRHYIVFVALDETLYLIVVEFSSKNYGQI